MPDPRGHDKISFSMTKRQMFKTWNKMTPDEAIQFFTNEQAISHKKWDSNYFCFCFFILTNVFVTS